MRFAFCFVFEDDRQSAVDVRDIFQVLTDGVCVVVNSTEYRIVRAEENAGSAAPRLFHFLDGRCGLAAFVTLHVFVAVTPNRRHHFFRQRIHNR